MPSAILIRPAEPADCDVMFSMIVALATYERAAEHVHGSSELLEGALFGPQPSAEALVAAIDSQPVGFAIFHGTFSTWECRPGIWLEDLFVPDEYRRAGVGSALLEKVARIALSRGCPRLEWAALNWNTPALRFYEQLDARRLDEWVMHRLEGQALERVGGASR
ncbi:MAG: GNAT family N-acetyltransferase [Solirubrobacteraceae bacterium]